MKRAAVVVAIVVAAACGGGASETEKEAAIAAAKDAYAKAVEQGVDMSNGPCLGVVLDNWVADVAHEPREEIDDDPANQCEAFRKGEVDHFVELDPHGDVIRAE